MPIPVTCRCGGRFEAPDNMAGQQVSCPSCHSPLTIQAQAVAPGQITAQCPSCRSQFAAPASLLGQQAACPTCHTQFIVSQTQQSADPFWDGAQAAAPAQQHAPQKESRKRTTQRADFHPRDGRVYIHKVCGEGTVVTGGDFVGICNPLSPCQGTFCASCQDFDRLNKFVWEETGETLSAYRKRLLKNTSPMVRFWWVPAVALGGILGAIIGPIFVENKMIMMPISAVGGMALMFFGIGPMIMCMVPEYQFYKNV